MAHPNKSASKRMKLYTVDLWQAQTVRWCCSAIMQPFILTQTGFTLQADMPWRGHLTTSCLKGLCHVEIPEAFGDTQICYLFTELHSMLIKLFFLSKMSSRHLNLFISTYGTLTNMMMMDNNPQHIPDTIKQPNIPRDAVLNKNHNTKAVHFIAA